MPDRQLEAEKAAKAKLPFLLAFLFVILAFASNGGFWAAVWAALAFFIGYLPIEKTLFFASGLEEGRRIGRETLHRLQEDQIASVLAIVRDGRKIEAIKTLREINNDGLREAKEAIDLLDEFGLKWRDSQDKPPR